MSKEEFKKLSKKCPWYYHNGEPRCSGNSNINCSKNKCAALYWIKILKKEYYMGEMAQDILNGLMCQECGILMEDAIKELERSETEILAPGNIFDNPPGYPRTCKNCLKGRR